MRWHRASIQYENGEHKSKAFDSKSRAEDYVEKMTEKAKAKKVKLHEFDYKEKQRD